MSFALHPTLAKDTTQVAELGVCRVLLMEQAAFAWLILVPRREGLRELHELSAEDYAAVMEEVRRTSAAFKQLTGAFKMNVAALGNMVPQLHIHIIARFEGDAAWPNPVWNSGVAQQAYDADERAVFIEEIQSIIS